jgi:hypothetical protein
MSLSERDDLDTSAEPSLEALVAGTVALMTAWADPCPQARIDAAAQRALLAHKVALNLLLLQRHAHASDALRRVMANAQSRWAHLAQGHALPPCAQALATSAALH